MLIHPNCVLIHHNCVLLIFAANVQPAALASGALMVASQRRSNGVAFQHECLNHWGFDPRCMKNKLDIDTLQRIVYIEPGK